MGLITQNISVEPDQTIPYKAEITLEEALVKNG